jgi:hypothetical protein
MRSKRESDSRMSGKARIATAAAVITGNTALAAGFGDTGHVGEAWVFVR